MPDDALVLAHTYIRIALESAGTGASPAGGHNGWRCTGPCLIQSTYGTNRQTRLIIAWFKFMTVRFWINQLHCVGAPLNFVH